MYGHPMISLMLLITLILIMRNGPALMLHVFNMLLPVHHLWKLLQRLVNLPAGISGRLCITSINGIMIFSYFLVSISMILLQAWGGQVISRVQDLRAKYLILLLMVIILTPQQ